MIFIPLDPSRPDAPQILVHLQALSIDFGRSPYIREFTRSILPADLGNNAQGAIARTVFDFVKSSIKYVPDPEGTEFVVSPVQIIEQLQSGQFVAGDCDDHVLLLNSMLRSMGYETQTVGVKLYSRELWDHVISSVNVNGRWVDLDPCAKEVWQPIYRERLVL